MIFADFHLDPLGFSRAERLSSPITAADRKKLGEVLSAANLGGASMDAKLDYLNTPREFSSDPPATLFATAATMAELSGTLCDRALALPASDPRRGPALEFTNLAMRRAGVRQANVDREADATQTLKKAAVDLGLLSEEEFQATFTLPPADWVSVVWQTPAVHALGAGALVERADLGG